MSQPSVVLDAATAEKGLQETLLGASRALQVISRPLNLHIVVYDEKEAEALSARELRSSAAKCGAKVTFHQAAERVPEKVESPVRVFKSYPNNPINTACRLAREMNGVFISTGNTGLVMTAALYEMGRIPGVERPPIATPWPTLRKAMFSLDSGANVDLRPYHLHQFAHIGRIYMEHVFGRLNPSIGLLSNGSEEYKGNALVRDTYRLLSADGSLNFTGYVEGQNFFNSDVDVVVHDGFLGNILLKFAEGLAATVNQVLRQEIRAHFLAAMAAALFLRPALRRYKKRFDYTEFGGAPLLGIKGNVVICHGRSDASAIMNAIRWGVLMVDEDIAQNIEREITEKGLVAGNGNSA